MFIYKQLDIIEKFIISKGQKTNTAEIFYEMIGAIEINDPKTASFLYRKLFERICIDLFSLKEKSKISEILEEVKKYMNFDEENFNFNLNFHLHLEDNTEEASSFWELTDLLAKIITIKGNFDNRLINYSDIEEDFKTYPLNLPGDSEISASYKFSDISNHLIVEWKTQKLKKINESLWFLIVIAIDNIKKNSKWSFFQFNGTFEKNKIKIEFADENLYVLFLLSYLIVENKNIRNLIKSSPLTKELISFFSIKSEDEILELAKIIAQKNNISKENINFILDLNIYIISNYQNKMSSLDYVDLNNRTSSMSNLSFLLSILVDRMGSAANSKQLSIIDDLAKSSKFTKFEQEYLVWVISKKGENDPISSAIKEMYSKNKDTNLKEVIEVIVENQELLKKAHENKISELNFFKNYINKQDIFNLNKYKIFDLIILDKKNIIDLICLQINLNKVKYDYLKYEKTAKIKNEIVANFLNDKIAAIPDNNGFYLEYIQDLYFGTKSSYEFMRRDYFDELTYQYRTKEIFKYVNLSKIYLFNLARFDYNYNMIIDKKNEPSEIKGLALSKKIFEYYETNQYGYQPLSEVKKNIGAIYTKDRKKVKNFFTKKLSWIITDEKKFNKFIDLMICENEIDINKKLNSYIKWSTKILENNYE